MHQWNQKKNEKPKIEEGRTRTKSQGKKYRSIRENIQRKNSETEKQLRTKRIKFNSNKIQFKCKKIRTEKQILKPKESRQMKHTAGERRDRSP